jgi:hypothetical protein
VTVTEFVISFVFMAVATMTILVVGTLGAADLLHLHRGKNDPAAPSRGADDPADRVDVGLDPEATTPQHKPQSQADAERSADVVDAMMPLGSSLSFNWHPRTSGADHVHDRNHDRNHDDPSHGRAA